MTQLPQLEDLGTAPSLDPFEVQPGAILLERFCVLGRVRHAHASWRVSVTDLERELGSTPHHRLMLHHLNTGPERTVALRRGLLAHQTPRRRVHGVLTTDDGPVVLTDAAEGLVLQAPASKHDALAVARDLAGVLMALHEMRLSGMRFDLGDLRVDGSGQVQFTSLHHLLDLRHVEGSGERMQDDLLALCSCLAGLRCVELDDLLRDTPSTAAGLLTRLQAGDQVRTSHSAADVLPQRAPFVGRGHARASVLRAIAEARAQGPRPLLITGPQGLGKTRLLSELASEIHRDKARVLHLSCDSGRCGLAMLAEQVTVLLQSCTGVEREQLRARIARALGPVLPAVTGLSRSLQRELGAGEDLPLLALDEAQVRRSAAVADLLAVVGTPDAPLVILLDGADDADEGTRRVLYHLLAPGRSHHTAIIASARVSGSSGMPADVQAVELMPLGIEPLQTLLESSLPGSIDRPDLMAATLGRASMGIPLDVWATLRQWVEQGSLVRADGVWHLDSAPARSVIELTRWVLDRLGADARWAVAAIAVSRSGVSLEQLRFIQRWSPDRTGTAVRELLRSGVVVEGSRSQLGFLHGSVRDQVLRDLTPAERRRAHQHCVQWLRRTHGGPIQLAWHGEHAVEPGADESLAALHVQAAQELLQGSHTERAAWHAERALERSPADAAPVRALELRGDALLLLDRIDDAVTAYRSAMAAEDSPERVVALADHVALALFKRGATDACRELCDDALRPHGQALPRSTLAALGAVLVSGVRVLLGRNPVDSLELADRLCTLNTTLLAILAPTAPLLALTCSLRARACSLGRHSGASVRARAFFSVLLATSRTADRMRALLDDAEADARAVGDQFELGIVHHFRAQNELELGHLDAGQAAATEALAAFRRAGDLSVAVQTMSVSIFHDLDRSPSDVLLLRLDQAVAAAWRQQDSALVPSLRAMELWVRVRRGDGDRTLEAMQLCDALEPSPQNQLSDLMAASFHARTLARLGQHERARRMADRAMARLMAGQIMPGFAAVAYLAVAEVELAASERHGQTDALRSAIRTLKRHTARRSFLQPSVQAALAREAILRGDMDAALSHLGSTLDLARPLGARWLELEAHSGLAELHEGRDILRARAHLDHAHQLAVELGVVDEELPIRAAPPTTVAAPDAPVTDGAPDLTELLRGLQRTVARALPQGLTLTADFAPDLTVDIDLEQLELLVVNLSLVARDASTRSGALALWARRGPAEPGEPEQVDIGLTGVGSIGSALQSQLAQCRQLAAELGTRVEVTEEGGQFELRLRIEGLGTTPRGVDRRIAVGVLHEDPRIQRTLVEGVTQLGYDALALRAIDSFPPGLQLALVSPASVLRQLDMTQVHIVPRRAARAASGHVLPFPFVLDELRDVLAQALEDDD